MGGNDFGALNVCDNATFGTYGLGLKEEADEKNAGSTEDESRRFRLRKDVAQLACEKSSGVFEDAGASDMVSRLRVTRSTKNQEERKETDQIDGTPY